MIKQQALQAVRSEIINSLYIDVRTKGQLDFDASMITNDGKRVRLVDEVTGQRLDPDPVRGKSSRTFKTNSCPLPPNAFCLSKTSKVVNMLPDNLNSLALYTYADKCSWRHVEIVSRGLWQAFKACQDKPFREKKEKTLKGMVFLAMQNWKHQVQTDLDLLEPARIRELLNINEHHWRRDWLPYWRQMHDLLSATDHQVLLNVYRTTGKKTRVDNKTPAIA